jgi:hypothetical protein
MKRWTILVAISLLTLAVAASADVIHVDCEGGGDYLTIQEGVDAASEGDTVLVAPGTYSGLGNCEVSFHGTNLVLLSSAGAESTVIDCQGSYDTAIRLQAGEDTTSIISGFAITNANTCIAALSSSPLITECKMLYPHEAGVYCQASGAIIRNTEFHGTTWDDIYDDGVLSEGDPGPTISHCVFEGCEEGLDAWGGSPIIRHCDFLRCGGMCCGTGAWCRYSSPLFEDCWFFECEKSIPGGGHGTAMRLDECDSVLRRVRFDHTFAGSWNFEVLYAVEGTLLLDRVVFWDNPVTHSAVAARGTSCEIAWCTFVDNWSEAVRVSYGASATIHHTIIAYNSGTATVGEGGEIATFYSCVFGNAGGDSLPDPHFENLFAPPLFCDREAGALTLRDDSPCLPANNPWGISIGAYGAGDCGTGIGGDGPLPGEVRLERIHPNPATGRESTISLAGSPGSDVEIAVFDVAGRHVRTLTATLSGRGRTELPWDLCDDAGNRLASGAYFVEVTGIGGVDDRATVVVVR